jgi:hypothetical protein
MVSESNGNGVRENWLWYYNKHIPLQAHVGVLTVGVRVQAKGNLVVMVSENNGYGVTE